MTNSNWLFIIDNTGVISPTGIYLQMFLQYKVFIDVSQNEETTILFLLIMLVVLIVIMLGIAIYLTMKIKKVEMVVNNYIKN